MAFDNKAPDANPIDLHVGTRIRLRRKFLGLSQSDLAEALGLTFQQVQKYERGSNRISASKLFQTARTLKAPVAYFFDGYAAVDQGERFEESSCEQNVSSFLLTNEGVELAESFPRVKSAKHRRHILNLVRGLAEEED